MNIDILVETDRDARSMYLLMRIAAEWQTLGNEVGVRRLDEPSGSADLSILHVDRSVVDSSLFEPHIQQGRILNSRVLDITKRRISKLLCGRGDNWDGPVIIKCNLNSGGAPEWIRDGNRWFGRRLRKKFLEGLPWRLSRRLGPEEYPVLTDIGSVPNWIWDSEAYVVERFYPERDGDYYITRHWVFMGTRESSIMILRRSPVDKYHKPVGYKVLDGVPDELREQKEALGFDFGKFDWVMADGRPVVLDANKTPTYRNTTERHPEIVPNLAAGIGDFA